MMSLNILIYQLRIITECITLPFIMHECMYVCVYDYIHAHMLSCTDDDDYKDKEGQRRHYKN